MHRPITPASAAVAPEPDPTDWRKVRALEMARRKARGWTVDQIARFYRVGRSIVYRELRSIPPELLARLPSTDPEQEAPPCPTSR